MRPALLDGDTLTGCFLHYFRACADTAVTFPAAGQRITGAELDEASRRAAVALAAQGVGPGSLVGLLLGPDVRFLVTLAAVLRTGAAVTILPTPVWAADRVGSVRRLAHLLDGAGIRHLVLDSSYDDLGRQLLEELPRLTIVGPDLAEPGGDRSLPAVDPQALAVVQFTSGSTSRPRGVALTQAAVAAGIRGNVISAAFSPDDVFIQWVPTFHDMGLIGLLSHLLNGASVHVFSPAYFLRRPAELLRYFAAHRGTAMAGPNFSYDHLLDALTPDLLAQLDLSSWRLAFNGAEPVSAQTTTRFTTRLAAAGVRPSVMYPVYGMAEATLSITFPTLGSPVEVLSVDRDALATTGQVVPLPAGHPRAKDVVSCGYPIHGIDLRLIDDHGGECGDGELGEIQIRGAAVTTGYYRDPEATADAFDGAWFRSGDLGFRRDGRLFVAGRKKEMVIVHGQNYFPDDVEAVARQVPGIFRGRCVAFADTEADGTEVVRVVAEAEPRAAGDLAAEIVARVERELAFPNVRVELVRPRWITRTTSGKWQRALTRRRLAELAGDRRTEPRPELTRED